MVAVLLVALALVWRRRTPEACGTRVRTSPAAVEPVKRFEAAASASAAIADEPQPGNEWIGGAIGHAERSGNIARRYASARPVQNASLLLIGVVSGSKNFDVRNWVRRAFWKQRPWRLGIGWRFVVGATVPRGDNDRVSLHYESARHGDIDIVRGSELPPRQARTALRWWLHAAALASRPEAPAFIGLTYDAALLSLPRLGLRLRSLAATRQLRSTEADRRFVYGGDLRWAAWPDYAGAGATWRCVKATTPAALLNARLAGDAGPPDGALTAQARQRMLTSSAASCGRHRGGGQRRAAAVESFVAASPELQILSSALLIRLRAPIAYRLRTHQLEVAPPPQLWDRSEKWHQTAAGRTPSQPALLAATAIARTVHNASRGRAIGYIHLRAAPESATFDWDAEPQDWGSERALLTRGVANGIMAEAAVEHFERQRQAAYAAAHVRCARAQCGVWGFVPADGAPFCCGDDAAGGRGSKPEQL